MLERRDQTNTYIKHTAKIIWYKKKQSDKNMYTNNPKWSHKEIEM